MCPFLRCYLHTAVAKVSCLCSDAVVCVCLSVTIPNKYTDILDIISKRPLVFPVGNLGGSLNENIRKGVVLLNDASGNVRSAVLAVLAILVASWSHLSGRNGVSFTVWPNTVSNHVGGKSAQVTSCLIVLVLGAFLLWMK
jgi:hypothetical protein